MKRAGLGLILILGIALAAGLSPRGAEPPAFEVTPSRPAEALAGSPSDGREATPAIGPDREPAGARALPEALRNALAERVQRGPLATGATPRQSASPGHTPSRAVREAVSPRRLALLEGASLLAAHGERFEVGGTEHRPYRVVKHGLPVLNRRGRVQRRDGSIQGVAGSLSFPPILRRAFALSREDATARALQATGAAALLAPPRAERGWLATPGETVPAWRVQLSTRAPHASWQVTLDAGTGEVLSQVDRLFTVDGTGAVYDPNVREAKGLSDVPLRDLDGSGLLSGAIVRVFDERDVEAFSPGLVFDFPTDDPRFVQTAVYRGLTDTGILAVANGFPAFAEPLLAFTNLGGPGGGEFNNAFYDPNLQAFGFGNGDGTLLANLGTDLDVAAHEMGHHIFEQLVMPEIESFADPVLAMHEGVADTFSVLIGGDLDVGESTVPGEKALRSLKGKAKFPDAFDPDPHVTGRAYGAANADMQKKLGEDFLPTFFAALPLLPPDAIEEDYPQAFLDADAATNGGLHAETLVKIFKKRGFENLVPKNFQGFLRPGVPEFREIKDGRIHLYNFAEFPGSTLVRFTTSGTGDVDLFAAPIEIYDPEDETTFKFVGGASSNESLSFTPGSVPSVHAGDAWLVAVIDFEDDDESTYTINVQETLPSAQIVVDGPSAIGQIGAAGEVDFWLFEGSAGDIVRLEVNDLTGSLDPLAAIVTVEDFELVAIDDDSGPGLDALIQGAELPTNGPFAVAVLSPLGDFDPTVGTGTYSATLSTCNNVGTDSDGDGFADVCDDDDDDDGFSDGEDTGPLDPSLCADVDDDTCDDCSSGSFDNLNDGPDVEGDGLCDPGDPDDDNDGCPDTTDPAPLSNSLDDDFDFLGEDCDNCIEVPNPAQIDSDDDGMGDACSSCSRVSWSDPPSLPPDQNPADSALSLKKLDQEAAALKASGVFGLPFAGPIDPASAGVYLRLADSEGQLFELNLPPGAPGSSACGLKDGWTSKVNGDTATYTYKNSSGALPDAACAPGSGGGKSSLKIVSTPTEISYKLSFKALELEGELTEPVRFLQFDLVLGEQAETGVGGAAGDAGLCAETLLRIGDPSDNCKVQESQGVLKSVSCKR